MFWGVWSPYFALFHGFCEEWAGEVGLEPFLQVWQGQGGEFFFISVGELPDEGEDCDVGEGGFVAGQGGVVFNALIEVI